MRRSTSNPPVLHVPERSRNGGGEVYQEDGMPFSPKYMEREERASPLLRGMVLGLIVIIIILIMSVFVTTRSVARAQRDLIEYQQYAGRQLESDDQLLQEKVPEERTQQVTFFIKVLACNRPGSLERLLKSVSEADYLGDTVHLDIFVDRCDPPEMRKACRKLAMEFLWPHGVKTLHFREHRAGLRTQWFELWYPHDNSSYAAILEDDMEVSPYFYKFGKQIVQRYSIQESDPHMASFCLHPAYVPRMNTMNSIFYKARAVCSWGALLLPQQWRRFIDWVDTRLDERDSEGRPFRPFLPANLSLTFATTKEINTWVKWKRDVWSAWQYRWMWEEDMYSLNYAFWQSKQEGLVVNHQEKGTNVAKEAMGDTIKKLMGPYDEFVRFELAPNLAKLELRDSMN
eukprot:jgi/Chlat1/4911/Chrsp31S04829